VAAIEAVGAREILDSRGNPTVEVEVLLDERLGVLEHPKGLGRAFTDDFPFPYKSARRHGRGGVKREDQHP